MIELPMQDSYISPEGILPALSTRFHPISWPVPENLIVFIFARAEEQAKDRWATEYAARIRLSWDVG